MTDQSRHASIPVSWADPTSPAPVDPLWRRSMPLLVWLGCLGAGLGLLLALGDGRLAAPVLTEPSTWAAWAAGRDPVEVTMVVLRLLALGLAWYLVGVTSISVIARVLRAARLVRFADALSVGPVRVLVQQAVGVGLAASVLATAVPGTAPVARTASAQAAEASATTLVMAPVEDATQDATQDELRAGDVAPVRLETTLPAAAEVLAPVPAPDPVPAVTAAPGSAVTPPAPPAPEVAPKPAVQATSREVRISPGDHFWSLAEQEVAAHLRRPGSEAEVVAHWQAIVEANADRLEVPGNPDLLLPGQLVVLPAVSEVLP